MTADVRATVAAQAKRILATRVPPHVWLVISRRAGRGFSLGGGWIRHAKSALVRAEIMPRLYGIAAAQSVITVTVGFWSASKTRRYDACKVYRRRRLRFRTVLAFVSRLAFAATRRRYRRTIASPEAPAMSLAVASKAASIFSRTISSASRWALLPPRMSFIVRRPMTRLDSTASIINEWNIATT